MQQELRAVNGLTLLEGSVSDLLINPTNLENPVSSVNQGQVQGIVLGNM
jgi:hypothetical protein